MRWPGRRSAAIRPQVDLQALNTLQTPSVAEYFVELGAAVPPVKILQQARRAGWPLRVLGGGSNVLLARFLPGLTLRQCNRGIEILPAQRGRVRVRVAAGENWHDFVCWCVQQGLAGLENLALIPGTVGAAPVQNIGAYGVELGPFVESLSCLRLRDGAAQLLHGADCEFAYRESAFKQRWREQLLIQAVTFSFPADAAPVCDYPVLRRFLDRQGLARPRPRQLFDAVVALRRQRLPDPAAVPNAGSFFKNPQVNGEQLTALLQAHPALPHFAAADRGHFKLAAAWLIEQCGFKQRATGPVRVHPEHALVLINPQRVDAAMIAAFAAEIVRDVQARFGLRLEQELQQYGWI